MSPRHTGRIALSCLLAAGLVLVTYSVAEQRALESHFLVAGAAFLAGVWFGRAR